jgi:hypothetical protein
MTKKERARKKYGLLPPKIAETELGSLDHGLRGSVGTHPFTIRTTDKTYSLLTLTMIDPATGWFEIVEATNKSAKQHPSRICFITPGWHVYPRPQFIVFDNGNVGKFKRELKQMCMQDNYVIKAKPTTSHNIPSTSKCNH